MAGSLILLTLRLYEEVEVVALLQPLVVRTQVTVVVMAVVERLG
jgi:hypothetical protein